jgi:malate synthase
MAAHPTDTKDKVNGSLRSEGVEIRGAVNDMYAEILTPAALAFLAQLARAFEGRRQELLETRKAREEEIRQGKPAGRRFERMIVDAKHTATNEIRGQSIQGGMPHHVSLEDIIIIPDGVPH